MEKNRIKRAWILIWYNDATRLVFVLLGAHLLLLIPLMHAAGLAGEEIKNAAIAAYFAVFFWAAIDNDYTNLERVGLDVYRKPIQSGRKSHKTTA